MGILIIDDIHLLKYSDIMNIYRSSIEEAAVENYPNMDRNEAVLLSEQDYYAYLDQVHFSCDGAYMALWKLEGSSVSAARVEPYKDGYLITGIETSPEYRRCGYAKDLLLGLVSTQKGPFYSHVFLENVSSIQLHLSVGFKIFSSCAEFSDGSFHKDALTLKYI